jgi:type VI secretion system secreted protein VgrG
MRGCGADLKDMQGKMVTVSVVRPDGQLRHFNGYVFEFRQVRTDGGYAFYDMVLLPWLAYLRLRRDNYLFHGMNVLEQTEDVFADYATVRDWQLRIQGEIPAVTDACQWDESDYNYLHRRWEALGWHYWYEHRADGHTLVLANDSLRSEPIDGPLPEVRWQAEAGSTDEDGIRDWTPVRRIVPAKVALASFDFKKPRPTQVDVPTINQQGQVLGMEVYEYEGAYGYSDPDVGEQLVRQRMQEIEANGKHFEAKSNNRFLQAGRWYRMTDHYDAHELQSEGDDGSFLVLSVRHEVANNYLQAAGTPAFYDDKFTCTRKGVPWRPGRGYNSEEPRIYGLQTAIVVGPKGAEIHTDAYGRVRVQFHWDRIGGYDEKSSAWIRVASSWTGKGYGFVSIPRVGQEVVVQFLDGNPDRPLVTGCVYNQDNMPPFGLPAGAHKTGFQTRSTPGGGGLCEMVIHDDAGKELINILSQKDMVTTVLNDKSTTVHSNHSTTVNGAKQTIAVTTGEQDTKVKQKIGIESTDSDIEIVAKTQITLRCGASTLTMDAEGNIAVNGKTIASIATADHTVKGATLNLNPPG